MRGRPCTECQASLFAKALVAAHPRLETRLLPRGRRSELVREGGTSGATFSLNLTSLSRTSEASPGPLLRPPGQNQKLKTARRACSRKRWWHNIQERTQSVQNGIPTRSVRNDNQLPCLTLRVTGLLVPHLDGAQSIALTTHLDLHRDSFVHFLDVGNHADLATLRLQAVEGVHRQLQ
ncbi:hypothetical protein ALQ54_101924 [Pseudomonas syringae]|nr:hypothetical protein ALQ54_101924 [Pseudomonas syringae]